MRKAFLTVSVIVVLLSLLACSDDALFPKSTSILSEHDGVKVWAHNGIPINRMGDVIQLQWWIECSQDYELSSSLPPVESLEQISLEQVEPVYLNNGIQGILVRYQGNPIRAGEVDFPPLQVSLRQHLGERVIEIESSILKVRLETILEEGEPRELEEGFLKQKDT